LKRDTAKDIAKAIIGNVNPNKANEIHRALGAILKAQKMAQAG
jgi:hypothetical protein